MNDDLSDFIRTSMPLAATLGVTAIAMSREEVILQLDHRPELCTNAGILHGGTVMALADTAGGAAAFANLPEGAVGTSTIESKTNFLRGVTRGAVTATARPLHVGSSTIVIETEVRNEGRLVAKTTQTQSVLRPR